MKAKLDTALLERDSFIPLFKGRPERILPISGDDLVNLKILLETEKNLNDFLENS